MFLLQLIVSLDYESASAVCRLLRLEANRLQFDEGNEAAAKPFADLATEIADAYLRERNRQIAENW